MNNQNEKLNSSREWLEWYEALVGGAVIAVLVFTFLFRIAVVQGSSMNPTLYSGERVLLWGANYRPSRGDVVVVDAYSSYGKALCKRVIATENDTVDINFVTGQVYVNGEELHEDYIADPTREYEGVDFPVTVPEGCVFVMGDNRMNSTDSRSPRIGFIDERDLLGKVMVRISPISKFGRIA